MSAANTWRTTELQTLATIDPETLGANTDADYHFHYIDVAAVSEGKIDIPSVSIAFRGSPSRARKVVKRGDVMMATVRPNLKAFAYFDAELDDCVASTGFAVLRAKKDVDAQFVLYSILSEPIARQIDAHIVGSNYPAITTTSVSRLKILAPPFAEQSKIAEVLSTVDRAIAQTEALIAKQQRIKTGLMQDLLTRGIDEHGQLRSEATHAFKDSPLGRIPVEWEVKEVKELCQLGRGRVISSVEIERSPGIYPVYSSQSKNDGLMGRLATYDFDGEYVTWTTDGAYAGTVFYRHGRFNCTNVCGTLQARGQVSMKFLAYQLATVSKMYVSYVGNPKLMNGVMGRILLIVPSSYEEQTEIVRCLNHQDEEIRRIQLQQVKFLHLKTALMQDLLTGKVRVTPLLQPAEAASA